MALTGIDFSDNYRRAAGAAQAGAVEPKILGAQEDTNIFKESEQKPAESVDVKPQDPVNPSSHVNGTTPQQNQGLWGDFQFGDLLTKPSSQDSKPPDPNLSSVSLFANIDAQQQVETRNDLIKEAKIEEDTQMQEKQEQELKKETAHLFAYV